MLVRSSGVKTNRKVAARTLTPVATPVTPAITYTEKPVKGNTGCKF